jgi:ketosteroid isomerase-like protein
MSTSLSHAALVERGYEAFNAADMQTLTELFDPAVIWHTPGRGPMAGDYHGRDATFGQFGRYGMQTNGTFRATLRNIVDGGDGLVVAMHHNTGARDGKDLDVDCCLVFRFQDGRIVECREYFSDTYAWDDFWS